MIIFLVYITGILLMVYHLISHSKIIINLLCKLIKFINKKFNVKISKKCFIILQKQYNEEKFNVKLKYITNFTD